MLNNRRNHKQKLINQSKECIITIFLRGENRNPTPVTPQFNDLEASLAEISTEDIQKLFVDSENTDLHQRLVKMLLTNKRYAPRNNIHYLLESKYYELIVKPEKAHLSCSNLITE